MRCRSRAVATRARVSMRFRAPPPSSSREITDWVVPMRSASSHWLSPGPRRRGAHRLHADRSRPTQQRRTAHPAWRRYQDLKERPAGEDRRGRSAGARRPFLPDCSRPARGTAPSRGRQRRCSRRAGSARLPHQPDRRQVRVSRHSSSHHGAVGMRANASGAPNASACWRAERTCAAAATGSPSRAAMRPSCVVTGPQ